MIRINLRKDAVDRIMKTTAQAEIQREKKRIPKVKLIRIMLKLIDLD